MFPFSLSDIQLVLAASLFLMGSGCLVTGIIILVGRGYAKELRMLAAQSVRLGQKGIAQEVTGLVSSAADLIASINELVRTASGIGVFLVILGLVLIIAAYWVTLQINWVVV